MNILTSSEKRKCVLCGRVTTVSLLFCRSGIEIRIPVCEKHQKDASFNLEGGLKHITDTIRHTFFLQASADMTRRKYPNIKEKKGAKMELNREQIIKALECCGAYNHGKTCKECPYRQIDLGDDEICSNRMSLDALALIKELTQANEQLSESYDHLEKTKDKLISERSRLTEENERLRGVGLPDDETYIRLYDAKTAIMAYIGEQTVSKYASSEECKAARNGAEGAMNELDYLIPSKVAPIADTVTELVAGIKGILEFDIALTEEETEYIENRIDELAKEMLEGL